MTCGGITSSARVSLKLREGVDGQRVLVGDLAGVSEGAVQVVVGWRRATTRLGDG